MTERSSPAIDIALVRKARSSGREFLPFAIASNGSDLFVHSWFLVYRRIGDKRLAPIGERGAVEDYKEALLALDGELWACGEKGLARSTDDGATFEPIALPEERMMAIAATPNGTIWVGGGYESQGVVACKRPDAETFSPASGPADFVTCMSAAGEGVLVGTVDGELWIGEDGALRKVHATSRPIYAVLASAHGTLFAMAGDLENDADPPTLHRSADGGDSFAETALPHWLLTMAQLPDGPIVAAGADGIIAVFDDDARSLTPVDHDAAAPNQAFSVSCVHGDAVMLGGPFSHLVEVRAAAPKRGAGAAKARANKPSSATHARGRGFVASGRFRDELASLLGNLKKRKRPRSSPAGFDEALAVLPAQLRSELRALHDLHATHSLPRLCGLREGGWCSIPAQYGLDEQGVVESEWFVDPDEAALVTRSIEIFNDQGEPFVIVGEHGVFAFYEDPHDYTQLADGLEDFLRVALALEAAARGKLPADKAEQVLAERIYVRSKQSDYEAFLRRTLAKAYKREA